MELNKRFVYKPKTYSTNNRAMKFGNHRDPAPIEMLNGDKKWIAEAFFMPDNRGIWSYYEVKTQKEANYPDAA